MIVEKAYEGDLRPWADARARAEWIKYKLGLNGRTIRALARELKVSQTTVASVVHGGANRFVEPEIARAVGVAPQWLFPEHYKNGQRLRQARPMRRGKTKRKKATPQVLDALMGPFGRVMPMDGGRHDGRK